MQYLIHDLREGIREVLNELDELPKFIEWVEKEYPGISKELIVRTFDNGQEIGDSHWPKNLIN